MIMDQTKDNLLTWSEFERVDMRVGKIIEVLDFPEARTPSYKLILDFGELGIKKSCAQITNYKHRDLVGRQIVAVVNFPAKQIGPNLSEVLILGAVDSDGVVTILSPETNCVLGSKIA